MNTSTSADIRKGLWLGLLGIVIFSVTLPMTRLAVGTPDAPQMSGLFIAMGRAVVATIGAPCHIASSNVNGHASRIEGKRNTVQ